MTNINRLASTAFTHGVALLIGWGGWTAVRRSHGPESAAAATNIETRKRATTAPKTPDEIISIIVTAAETTTTVEQEKNDKRIRAFRAEFLDLVKTLSVPEDFASALAEEMKLGRGDGQPTAKVAALMFLWMMRNPAALIRWAGQNNVDPKFQALNSSRIHCERIPHPRGNPRVFS